MVKFGINLNLGKDTFSNIYFESSDYPYIHECYEEILNELKKWEKFFPQIVTPKIKILDELIK